MEAGHFQMRKPLNKVWMRLTLIRPLFVKSKKVPERVDSITNKITDTYINISVIVCDQGHC